MWRREAFFFFFFFRIFRGQIEKRERAFEDEIGKPQNLSHGTLSQKTRPCLFHVEPVLLLACGTRPKSHQAVKYLYHT